MKWTNVVDVLLCGGKIAAHTARAVAHKHKVKCCCFCFRSCLLDLLLLLFFVCSVFAWRGCGETQCASAMLVEGVKKWRCVLEVKGKV